MNRQQRRQQQRQTARAQTQQRTATRAKVDRGELIPSPPTGHPTWHYWWNGQTWYHHDERIIEYITTLDNQPDPNDLPPAPRKPDA